MDNSAANLLTGSAIIALAVVVFLIALLVAPLKLYSIHHEIRRTNALLQQQIELLTALQEGSRFQGGLLVAITQASKAYVARTPE
jgi:hypothetical protein